MSLQKWSRRCRSFFDKQIELEIDNGNHLVFSANNNFLEFCKTIGSLTTFKLISKDLKFFDITSSHVWEFGLSDNLLKDIFLNAQFLTLYFLTICLF